MRKTILTTLALILITLIWACSSKTTTKKIVSPVPTHDSSRPTVVSTTPADGDSNVALDVAITVVFSEDMDPTTLNDDCFYITGGFNGTVNYDNKTAVFTPTESLDSATLYYAVVHLQVTDTAGNRMQDHYHWSFSTVGYSDTTTPPDTIITDTLPLKIVTVDPPNGAADVSYIAAFTVTFSKDVDPSTVNDSSFFLSDRMPGKITVSAKTATLTPSAPLGGNRIYTVTVTTQAADFTGHHLADNYTWSVTTEPVEIMPLAVGNQWVYHSVRSDTLGHVISDTYGTISITGTEVIAEDTWFLCNDGYKYSNRPDGLWKFCQNNVLYRQFPTRPGTSYETGAFMDYSCAWSWVQVTRTDTVVTVPAGTFHCIAYHAGDYYTRSDYYYAPNVGLIRSDAYQLGYRHTGSSVLTEYQLP